MILYKTIKPLENKLQQLKKNGKTIGFVPTMGALHAGHLSLITQCNKSCDISVCSIFVNPTQFNVKKDFEKYPLKVETDIRLLEANKTHILLLPSVSEVYPNGLISAVHYDIGTLENILEGFYRPGHFRGVCQVVHRLLEIVQPDELFLGQKDYQQCMVIKKLIELFNMPVKTIIGPTLREADGLALSSRNQRLGKEARQKAPALFKALSYIKNNFTLEGISVLKQKAFAIIQNGGFEKIDYVEICNANTLQPISQIEAGVPLIALTAAFIGDVRLIDNMIIN